MACSIFNAIDKLRCEKLILYLHLFGKICLVRDYDWVNKHTLTLSSTKTHCFQFCFFALLFFVFSLFSMCMPLARNESAHKWMHVRWEKLTVCERPHSSVSFSHSSTHTLSLSTALSLCLPFVRSVCVRVSILSAYPYFSDSFALICSWNRFFSLQKCQKYVWMLADGVLVGFQ